ncbi:hypothetical protein GC173_17030 [bacterium]|nr:hypothetical protein [bacterium]
MQQKPISVVVVAVFGIIFGVIGLCLCTPLSIVGVLFPEPASFGNLDIPPPSHTPLEKGTIVFSLFMLLLASALLVAGSIGSFFFKPWARWCSLSYAVLYIVGSFVFNVANARAANIQSQAVMQAWFPAGPVGGGSLSGVTIVTSAIFATLCSCIFPIIVLVVYNLPSVRRAFSGDRSNFGPPPGTPGGGYPQAPWPGQAPEYQQPPQGGQGYYPTPQYGTLPPPQPNYYPPAQPYPGDELPPPPPPRQ